MRLSVPALSLCSLTLVLTVGGCSPASNMEPEQARSPATDAGTPSPGHSPTPDAHGGKDDARNTPDDSPPLKARQADTCGLTLTDIALYQSVKVPLVQAGLEIKKRAADIVQERRALVRVFVRTGSGWASGKVAGTLTIGTRGKQKSLSEQRVVSASSTDATLDSTLNFDVPDDQIADGATYSFALTAPAACATVRFPADGSAALGARRVGALKIKLVPIRYGSDGSDRMPDTDDDQLKQFRARLLAMYPVESVQLTVRAPVRTMIKVTGEPDGWNDLLDSMRDLRAQDHADPDVFYYGLISPAKNLTAYCPDACYLGLSFRSDQPAATLQAGVGLGFSGDLAPSVLAHELGHLTGRKHAPCKTTSYLDPGYPQAEGKTGSWGWDDRTRTLFAPDATRDVMGYCSPAWISEYNFGAILDRLAKVNGGANKPASLMAQSWRVLLATATGAHWGAPFVDAEPAGVPESAEVLDEAGTVVATVPVWRAEVGDEGASSVLVPEPQPHWSSIRLHGLPALRFDQPSPAPAFER